MLQERQDSSASLASAGTVTTASSSSRWIIDSGATHHLTGEGTMLSSSQPSATITSVRLANGSHSPVTAVGRVSVSPHLSLTGVLCAPEFPLSLLSVCRLCTELNCRVIFDKHCCYFQDIQTMQVIGGGHERNGLYYLDTPTDTTFSGAASITADPLLWHFRLGHPSAGAMSRMFPELSSLPPFQCEACQFGKHHRSSFPPRDGPRSSIAFELVHCDVWGPCPVRTMSGHKYFAVFVDDYSRSSWVFLLKERSEVCTVIK
jgi:hypothetical protein